MVPISFRVLTNYWWARPYLIHIFRRRDFASRAWCRDPPETVCPLPVKRSAALKGVANRRACEPYHREPAPPTLALLMCRRALAIRIAPLLIAEQPLTPASSA